MKKMLMLALAGCLAAGAAETNLIVNGDFETAAKNGKPESWLFLYGTPSMIPGGVSGKALQVVSAKVDKYWKTSMYQKISSLKQGKYILSGCVKGDCRNLWLVLQWNGAPKAQPFKAWLPEKDFSAPDKAGFRRFTVSVTAPENATGGTLHVEGFASKENGAILFDDFRLAAQLD